MEKLEAIDRFRSGERAVPTAEIACEPCEEHLQHATHPRTVTMSGTERLLRGRTTRRGPRRSSTRSRRGPHYPRRARSPRRALRGARIARPSRPRDARGP
jgi:hypothetical protein